MTLKKQMLNWFGFTTKAALLATVPVSPSKVVFGKNHSFLKEPKENFIFRGTFIRQISCIIFTPLLIRYLYMDFIEKVPFLLSN